MTHPTPVIGDCPRCGTTVPASNRLIDYERDGEPTAFAECPDCAAVVRPS